MRHSLYLQPKATARCRVSSRLKIPWMRTVVIWHRSLWRRRPKWRRRRCNWTEIRRGINFVATGTFFSLVVLGSLPTWYQVDGALLSAKKNTRVRKVSTFRRCAAETFIDVKIVAFASVRTLFVSVSKVRSSRFKFTTPVAARRCQDGAKVNLDLHNKNSLVKFTRRGLNCESWGLKKKKV